MRTLFYSLFAAVLATVICAAVVRAEPALAKRVLEVGWKQSLSSLKAAETIAKGSAGDTMVDQALMLIYVRHSRYDRAAKIAESLAAKETATIDDLRNVAWMRMISKEYSRAIAGLLAVAERFDSIKDANQQADVAAFLGRQFGFLSGPAKDEITFAQHEKTGRLLRASLKGEHLEIFEHSAKAVQEEFLKFSAEKSVSESRAQLNAEESRARKLEDLAKQRIDISQQISQIDTRRAAAKAQADAQKSVLATRQQTAIAQLSAAQRELAIRQSRLNTVLNDIRLIEFRLAEEEAPFFRDQLFAELRGAQATANRLSAYVREAIDLANIAGNTKLDIDRQISILLAQEQAELAKIDQELSSLRRRDKSFAAQESKARRTLDPKLGESRFLKGQATALTTYDVFPLESERQRLIDQLEGSE